MKISKLVMLIFFVGYSFTSISAEILFDSSYKAEIGNETDTRQDINSLVKEVNDSSKQYIELLKNADSFKGLYIRLEDSESLDSDYYDRKVALEMELFDNGWREGTKIQEKKSLQSELDFFQLQRNMQIRKIDDERYRINLVKNFVHYQTLSEILDFYKKLSLKRKTQLDEGLIDKIDMIGIDVKLAKINTSFNFYQAVNKIKIKDSWFELLNYLEKVTLKEEKWMHEKAKYFSYDLKIHDLLIKQQTEFYPDYLDKVSLRLFVERRENNRLLTNSENMLGVRVRLPIDFDSSRDDIINSQKRSHRSLREVIVLRLYERINSLKQLFEFKKQSLINLQHEYEALTLQAEVAIKQKSAVLLGLKYTPERKLEEIEDKQLNLKQNILLTRLDVMDNLIQLSGLIGFDGFEELIN